MVNTLRSGFTTLRRHCRAIMLSGGSQIVSSLTNFGIALYLVRILDKPQFGLYGLGFASVMIIAVMLSALFSVQFVVNVSDQEIENRSSYALHHIAAVAISGLAMMIAVMLAVNSVQKNIIPVIEAFALPITVAAATFALRDILMRVAFVNRREIIVFINAATVAFSIATVYLLLGYKNIELTALKALYIYAIGQFAGIIQGLIMLKLPWKTLGKKGLIEAFSHSWKGGRWHVMTSMVHGIRIHIHNFIIPPILGLAVLAEINAARILLSPVVLAIPPIYQLIMPRLAERRTQGLFEITRMIVIVISGLTVFATFYCAGLFLTRDTLLPLLLGKSYSNLNYIIIAWSVYSIVLVLRNGLTMAMEVLKFFRGIFSANVVAASVAIVLAVWLSIGHGGTGIVWALVIAEFTLCLILTIKLMRISNIEQPLS